jgi:hypothetical protein
LLLWLLLFRLTMQRLLLLLLLKQKLRLKLWQKLKQRLLISTEKWMEVMMKATAAAACCPLRL